MSSWDNSTVLDTCTLILGWARKYFAYYRCPCYSHYPSITRPSRTITHLLTIHHGTTMAAAVQVMMRKSHGAPPSLKWRHMSAMTSQITGELTVLFKSLFRRIKRNHRSFSLPVLYAGKPVISVFSKRSASSEWHYDIICYLCSQFTSKIYHKGPLMRICFLLRTSTDR